ncbi:Uncharacterized protein GBIM_16049 [Gryllus bimaculatus]|nr:Uncharacterized protein GBIM_16049 [Gryllus bimaculatus]
MAWDQDLSRLLQDCRENVSLLTQAAYHLVNAILKIKWAHRSECTVRDYQGFLVDLLSAHNYYTKIVFDELVATFKSADGWENETPSKEENNIYNHVHEVLEVLLQTVPMSLDLLKEVIEAHFPYLRRNVHEHQSYIYNMLKILHYQPVLRTDFLFLLIDRLIILDVNAPKHEIMDSYDVPEDEQFQMELGERKDSNMTHSIADTFDCCLNIVFQYLYVTCYDTSVKPAELKLEETKQLFQEILSVFDSLILPTHGTHHVQFIVFYMCTFKVQLADMFLTYLWQKVTSTRVANVIRQTAVAYFSSFLARNDTLTIRILMNRIAEMTEWVHNYISKQDGAEGSRVDIRVHPVFYSVCQAIFYVTSCRYSDFVHTKKGLLFLQGLNLTKIVTCDLNPLKVCQPEIVHSFATITRNFQLAYCFTIIEHNSRTHLPVVHLNDQGVTHETTVKDMLDTFFPFDPYVLKRSSKFISPNYNELKAPFSEERMCSVGSKHDEDDDFLNGYSSNTPTMPVLSVSPSF